jgi:hypothetical protein
MDDYPLRCAGFSVARAAEVDAQFIFGFTMGADVGELGEREIELESAGRFGKQDGAYTALENRLRAEFTPTKSFRLEIGAPVAYHSIDGITGLDNRQQGAFDSVSFEARYRLLDRDHMGSEGSPSRSMFVSSSKPLSNYGTLSDRNMDAKRATFV